MKKLSLIIAIALSIIFSSCNENKLPYSIDIGASLSNMAFSNNNTIQTTLLTVRLSKPVTGPIHFTIADTGYDYSKGKIQVNRFSPSAFDTVLTAKDSVISFPITFNGNSEADLVAISIVHKSTDTMYKAVAIATIGLGPNGSAYNELVMPVLDSGREVGTFIVNNKIHSKRQFDLSIDSVSHQFRQGNRTPTFCYNSEKTNNKNEFLGPTLSMNIEDSIFINVKNNLPDTTTTHWHGFHIPAEMDGGPHEPIAPATTWKPFFLLQKEDNAALYWYHPHLHHQTYHQVTMGAAGMIIMRGGPKENIKLPRNYGVDDIPIVLTSRRFLSDNSFAIDPASDQFGDYLLTNGIMSATTALPRQLVRIRILNAEIERGYNIGFNDNRPFTIIGTDAGLLSKPDTVTRLYMLPGERIEFLLDLSKDKPGASLDLKAFNTALEAGFPGSNNPIALPNGKSGPAFESFLSNTDFNLLHITVKDSTAGAIYSIPNTLVNNYFWKQTDVTDSIVTHINGIFPKPQPIPFFYFDSATYDYNYINYKFALNAVVKWTFVNNKVAGHPVHIHDIAFNILKRTNNGISTGPFSYENGWKDVFYIRAGETVEVLAYYNDFTDPPKYPYMFHCHILTHEDGGLMGQFIVDSALKPRPVRHEQDK